MTRVVIIVGEASGDQLAAGLIRALRARIPDIQIEGVTGPQMRAAGCATWADSEQLAVMGLAEVVKHLPALQRLMRQLVQRLQNDPPDLVIGIDAPDFNLRLLKRVRALGMQTVQYVCPSVWAWRSGRVKTIAAACDQVLCLLPFEAGFLRDHGIAAEFVGHPLADEIEPVQPVQHASGRTGNPVVAVLPGSRRGEVSHLGPVFIDAMQWLEQRKPGIRFVSGAANPATEAMFRSMVTTAGLEDKLNLELGGARAAMQAADIVLLASGTATLEAMLLEKPMVVAYKISYITIWILRIFRLVKIKRFALPNLLAGTELVPEFIQERATGPAIGAAVLAQLEDPAAQAAQRREFVRLGALLRKSASEAAADAVLRLLHNRAATKPAGFE